MVSNIRTFWTALAAVAAMIGPVVATPAMARDEVIRFGLTGDYPPFAEQHQDGSLSGADVETARKLARDMGARAEFVMTSWTRLSADFADRKFDVAIGGLTITPERAALGTFSTPLLDDGKRPLALCTKRMLYRSLSDIDVPGVRVQINRGPEMARLAAQWLRHASLLRNTNDDTLTANLLDGTVDVWITDGVVVDRMARQSNGRLCSTMGEPLTHVQKAWLIRNDASLVRRVNKGLKRALRDGSWQAALQKN